MDKPELQTLLARQAIYDKEGSIFAYELLYRNNNEHFANVDNTNENDAVRATSSVISHLFTNFDIDSILDRKCAFINFSHSDLIQKIPKLLPKNRIMIEVLETTIINHALISNLMELHAEGYKIALDDFIFRAELIPLIAIADFIKIDVLNQTEQDIEVQLNHLKGYKGKLLAEKIDNKEQFNRCMDLGFDYFQGFFLNKPDQLQGQIITENKIHILRVMAELNREDLSMKELESMILQIPKLSYRILRISNSVYYYSRKKNDSLSDALFHLGLLKIRSWTMLILLASTDDASPDLLARTLIRANMCEALANAIKYPKPHEAYTVGIFSTLDGMLNESMPSLLAKIQLSEPFNQALLHYEGDLGKLLKCAIDYEQANFNAIDCSLVDTSQLTRFYLQGIDYANTILQSIIH